MNKPLEHRAEKRLASAIHSLSHDQMFLCFMGWIQDELKKRDVENRSKEFANKTSEAEALGFIVEYVAACQSSDADRNSNTESGDEGSPLV
jgi:hypothetical protein